MPGGYRPEAARVIASTHGQLVTASLLPNPGSPLALDLRAATLSGDAGRIPRWQLEATIPVPNDQATIDLFDPRTDPHVTVDAGYQLTPGLINDVQPLAKLGLTYRSVARPADVLTLRAGSDESYVIENVTAAQIDGPAVGTSAASHIDFLIKNRWPEAVTVIDANGSNVATAWYVAPGQNAWAQIESLADAGGLEVFGVPTGGIKIRARPTVASPVAALDVGATGTVTESFGDINRDQFANDITLIYAWNEPGGAPHPSWIIGHARTTTGPYAYAPGRRLSFVDLRSTPIGQAEADAAAGSVLARRFAAGRGMAVTALNAFWIRPGDTVNLTSRVGPTLTQLVQTVAFDLVTGSMTLTTRDPAS